MKKILNFLLATSVLCSITTTKTFAKEEEKKTHSDDTVYYDNYV